MDWLSWRPGHCPLAGCLLTDVTTEPLDKPEHLDSAALHALINHCSVHVAPYTPTQITGLECSRHNPSSVGLTSGSNHQPHVITTCLYSTHTHIVQRDPLSHIPPCFASSCPQPRAYLEKHPLTTFSKWNF